MRLPAHRDAARRPGVKGDAVLIPVKLKRERDHRGRLCTAGLALTGAVILLGGFAPAAQAQMTVSARIEVGRAPSRVAISPDGSEIYVANTGDDTISIISTASEKLVATKRVGRAPAPIVFSADGRRAYIGLQGGEGRGGRIAVFDTRRREVAETLSVDGPRACPAVDLTIHADGKKLYAAFVYCGLYRLDTDTNALTRIDPDVTPCPEGIAFTPDGNRAYVNYQCAPPPGTAGHDPIFVFDARADCRIDAITHIGNFSGAPPIANVGSFIAVSPDGRLAWANGVDACARSNLLDPGGYDFKGCPQLDPHEQDELTRVGYVGRGIMNVIDLQTRQVIAKGFRAREVGSDKLLGASVPTFFPDGRQVAVSTESRILIFDAGTLNQIGTGIPIPRAGNLVFSPDGRKAYAASQTENRLYAVALAPASEPGWLQSLIALYARFWTLSFWTALISHGVGTPVTLWIVAFFSVRFAWAFSNVPSILVLVEADIFLRGARARFVRLYLKQLAADIVARRSRQGAAVFVSLPVRRGSARTQADTWLKELTSAVATPKSWRGAIIGSGGTGKTFLVEELVLRLVEAKCVPLLLEAVDYKGEASLAEWMEHVVRAARVPIRVGLLQSIPSLVLLIDQVSEVRVDNQQAFWDLFAGQWLPGAAKYSLVLAGRRTDAYARLLQPLSYDVVDLEEDLDDDDIRRLGAAYLDPTGQSEEVKGLPKTIRAITAKPTAFIVSHYARARTQSSRPIGRPEDLYEEILDRHIRPEPGRLRPDVVKSVLQAMVGKHLRRFGNRGLPLERKTLEKEVAEIFKAEELEARFGVGNIPSPKDFVDQLLSSGLLYGTQSSYMFFHDSFEDWLLQEASAATRAPAKA